MIMEDRRVADYFVVAGLPDNPEPLDEFSYDGNHLKSTHNQAPITDVSVIFRSLGETPPAEFTVIELTPNGFPANLNHGSLRSPSVYFCYRRGRDKPPLLDIGVLYQESKERLMPECKMVLTTSGGRSANVNNSGSKTFITYRRAAETAPCNELVVTDICVILANKGESPPHAFCMISRNLNKGMVGSDVYLCYKKSMNRANSIAYKPALLGQFPLGAHADFPLPSSVPLFCLPMGATIECWPAEATTPSLVFSTFVLTVSHAVEKVYGAAVTFYERYPEKKLNPEQKQQLRLDGLGKETLNSNKSICLLSHWPFFDTFEKFLRFLHRMSNSGPHVVPIERYISHFMLEVPFPSPKRPRILIQLNTNNEISLAQPEDSPLPLSGASFRQLLMNLGPDNCLTLLLFALTEQKILIHSLRPDVLTSTAEAVSMMIFPFHWQCPYIPLCPLGLSDVLSAPMPFIVGVDSRYFDLYDPPQDVTCVDLDTNTTSVSEDKKSLTIKLLPKKPCRVLRNSLQMLFEKLHQLAINYSAVQHKLDGPVDASPSPSPLDKDFRQRRQERSVELEIQEAFLRFMASVLKGFRSFLQPITTAPTIGATDCSSLFDIQGFLKSRDKSYHRFYQMLLKTQMFTRFIEERSFVSDKDASLAFFDDCTEKVDAGEYPEPRLLELDESQTSERTVFVMPPEALGLPPDATYTYKGIVSLDPRLFHHQKHQLRNMNVSGARSSPAPNSPLARRTKHEIRYAQQMARKLCEKPNLWSKCLMSYSYSLWFIHLPAYVQASRSKPQALWVAYDTLTRMHSARLQPPDEVCYRVLMQLCGQYSQPVLAVKLLFDMKQNGVHPNAITYGYYNKAVLESKWPAAHTNGYLLWNKLRNVIIGVALFKRSVTSHRVTRPLSTCSESDCDGLSHGSAESGTVDAGGVRPDDGASTGRTKLLGGQSDMGYSSMITDDTQKSSSSISSSSQHTAGDLENGADLGTAALPILPSKSMLEDTVFKDVQRKLKFDEVDFRASDAFRSRVGSIVRSSVTALANANIVGGVRGSTTVESSAGILIPGNALLFDAGLGLAASQRRKRHYSASTNEYGRRTSREHSRHFSDSDGSQKPQRPHIQGYDVSITVDRTLRSDDFAGDAQILSHLDNGGDGDGRHVGTSVILDASAGGSLSLHDTLTARPSSPSIPIRPHSGSTSPRRTPVTENDPLGLFTDPASTPTTTAASSAGTNVTPAPGSPLLTGSWLDLEMASTPSPILRDKVASTPSGSPRVGRSATFCSSPTKRATVTGSGEFPRSSSTMLGPSQSPSAAGFPSLANFRIPFSPSQRHTDFLLGGLSSLRSAASSMATKLSEIREAISYGTPSKGSGFSRPQQEPERCSLNGDYLMAEDEDLLDFSGRSQRGTEDSFVMDEVDSNVGDCIRSKSLPRVASNSTLQELLQDFPSYRPPMTPSHCNGAIPPQVALEVSITSCSRCHTCNALLYDEEIMANWKADDSNLNTQCQFCSNKVVPFLTINIKDYRLAGNSKLIGAPSVESVRSVDSAQHRHNATGSILESLSDTGDRCEPSLPATWSAANPAIASKGLHRSDCSNSGKADERAELLVSAYDAADSLASSRASSVADMGVAAPLALDSLSVPYLSPLVLRKELETVLDHEGDSCLGEAHFVDEHPIIFWNMMWFFKRIDGLSHLPGLCLNAKSINKDREMPKCWSMADSRNVLVRTLWDNPVLHEDIGTPMYITWSQTPLPSPLVHALQIEQRDVTRALMQRVILGIECNDLSEPVNQLIKEVRKKAARRSSAVDRWRHHGIYRDILFLAISILGHDSIDLVSFDREYRRAFEKLSPGQMQMLHGSDHPPTVGVIFCRRSFRELEL